jgi:hypothetical protein
LSVDRTSVRCMSSGGVADREEILAALDTLDAAFDTVAGMSMDTLTHREVLTVQHRIECLARRMPTLGHRLIARLAAEASPVELGARSLRDVLRERLRISGADAKRRIEDSAVLGPRTALSGEGLEPVLPLTAQAQSDGRIGAEHVRIIRRFFDRLPAWVDLTTREQAEATLVRTATGLDPDLLRKAADRLATLIDQDGPQPDDTERARRRGLWIGKQGADGMTPVRGNLDPQALATLEPMIAKWAGPGMCNPDDPTQAPRVSGTPSKEQIEGDHRSVGQRNHDALIAIGRSVLSSGELGQHNGLPVTIIVSTTLQDLESARGSAVTAGGTLLPMADTIRLASHAHHYLAIYDKHTREPLYLGRTRRCASPAQRMMLLNRDLGCTRPGCPVDGYGTQVHHIKGWVKDHGETNIDLEVLACPADNRLAEEGWTVRIRNGKAEWIPPPHLDTGQPRVNDYHHPHRMLADPEEPEDD